MTARPQHEGATAPAPDTTGPRSAWAASAWATLLWATLGAALIVALSQVPARHEVDLGGYDAAYVQGFHEPETFAVPPRSGSDGLGRWSRASSALIFPQAGLPGTVVLTLNGPPEGTALTVLLNGTTELARVRAAPGPLVLTLPVTGGVLKATDFFIELRATPTTLPDGREVGVLVDEAVYTAGPGPLAPYPSQVLYGALVGALLWRLLEARAKGDASSIVRRSSPALWLLLYGILWLLLYRLQPPLYPHPLRALPLWVVGALAAALALRDGPALAARWPWLIGVAAPALVMVGWTAMTLVAAHGHVTLSRPGVESDFRVFATRESLAQIFSADGFYNLGYPLLLWLARPFADGNAFLAGRLVAALSGVALLGAGYWLARTLLPAGPAMVALAALGLSGLVAQYGLYVGSDMPFAACVALCAAALVAATRGRAGDARGGPTQDDGAPDERARRSAATTLAVAAGVFGGMAFLMRHLGLVLLPWGLLALLLGRGGRRAALAYGAAFVLAMAPQIAVNIVQAGDPLYNQQAKNIWLAVYGGTDWGRWEEAPNTISLAEVVLRDPARFLENWWRNMVAYAGSGAEDTSEFGRALQLRLLGFPANWLAVGALLWWLAAGARALGQGANGTPSLMRRAGAALRGPQAALLLLVLVYVAGVSTAFVLPRFFLPLAPVYAVGAGWALWRLAGGGRALLGASLALIMVLWGGYGEGTRYVLANQPADEVALVTMVTVATPPEALIATRVAGRLPVAKYSAIAHRVVEWPGSGDLARPVTAADLEAARAAGATYLVWDEGTPPPPLEEVEAARVASSGRYALYRIE